MQCRRLLVTRGRGLMLSSAHGVRRRALAWRRSTTSKGNEKTAIANNRRHGCARQAHGGRNVREKAPCGLYAQNRWLAQCPMTALVTRSDLIRHRRFTHGRQRRSSCDLAGSASGWFIFGARAGAAVNAVVRDNQANAALHAAAHARHASAQAFICASFGKLSQLCAQSSHISAQADVTCRCCGEARSINFAADSQISAQSCNILIWAGST